MEEGLVGACLQAQPALWGERDTWYTQKTETTQKEPRRTLGVALFLVGETLSYCLRHTMCFRSSWSVAPISSSCTLPALKHAISLHAPPFCFVALLVMSDCRPNGAPEIPIRSSTANQSF